MPITYTKSGDEWCLRIPASETTGLKEGATVTVTKKDGSTKTEVLGQAINIQKEFTIALIATPKQPRQQRGRRARNSGRYAPNGAKCPYCGSRECPRAWNPNDLCEQD